MGKESSESTVMAIPNFLRRAAIWLSKLIPFIAITPDDESPEADLETGASTNHFKKPSPTNSTSSSFNTTDLDSSSQSSTTSGSPAPHKPTCECEGQQKLPNPIAQAFRELELGKVFLTFIMPLGTMILLAAHKMYSPQLVPTTLCLISLAFVFLFYGSSLRHVIPKTANVFEQLGAACIYASFFMALGSHLPLTLVWVPLGCFIACVALSIVSCLPLKKKICAYCNKILKPPNVALEW